MSPKSSDRERLPEISVESFEKAASLLAKYRDEGHIQFFVARRNWLRFIGDVEDLKKSLVAVLTPGTEADQSSRLLDEVKTFFGIRLNSPKLDSAMSEIRQTIYSRFSKEDKENDEESQELVEIIKGKLECVDRYLLDDALRERIQRLATATGSCLEDLDLEILTSRNDEVIEREIRRPFARIRIRYSKLDDFVWPFFSPQFNIFGKSVPGFEIECDKSDIDLMIRRLRAAKERLVEAEKRTD